MLLSLGLIQSDTQNCNFACCFTWVWNVVGHTEGGAQAKGFQEQGAEENIWASERRGNRGVEQAT